MSKIEKYRKLIDGLDDEIKDLLLKRLGYCKKIGESKKASGSLIESKSREEEILSRLTENVTIEESKVIKSVYESIFTESKNVQQSLQKKLNACLVGTNISHSLSPKIHEFFGTNYCLKTISNDEFKDFYAKKEFPLYNVTMPFKKEVIDLLDEVSLDAKAVGAVNTVMRKDGKMWGYNTDIDGLNYLFTSNGVSLKDKKTMILGTGGTSKTAQALVKKNGGEFVLVGRNSQINYQNYHEQKGVEILINTTPVGLDGKSCLIDVDKLCDLKFCADVLYYPLKTPLVFACEERKIKCEGGLKMLVYQALKSEEIWQNENFEGYFDKAYRYTLHGYKNIVLIGMPSCGKTVTGKCLSEKLKMNFIDTDEEIEKTFGLSPEEIILKNGEEYFRNLESEIIDKISMKTGFVIATGGGSVLRSENIRALKRNAVICYVDRPINLLGSDNRPLSEKYGIENLYEMRKDIYLNSCDFTVKNDGYLDECALRIIKEYEKNLDN